MKYLRILQVAAATVLASFSFGAAAASFAQSGFYDFRIWIQSDPSAIWESSPQSEYRDNLDFQLDSDGRFYIIGSKDSGLNLEAKAIPSIIYQDLDGKKYKLGEAVNTLKIPLFSLPNGYDIRYTGYFSATGTYSGNPIDRSTVAISGLSDDGGGTGGLGNYGVDGLDCAIVDCDADTRTFHYIYNQNATSPGSFSWLAYTQGTVSVTLYSYASISIPVPESSSFRMTLAGLLFIAAMKIKPLRRLAYRGRYPLMLAGRFGLGTSNTNLSGR